MRFNFVAENMSRISRCYELYVYCSQTQLSAWFCLIWIWIPLIFSHSSFASCCCFLCWHLGMQGSKASTMFDSQKLGSVICSNSNDYNLILIFKGDVFNPYKLWLPSPCPPLGWVILSPALHGDVLNGCFPTPECNSLLIGLPKTRLSPLQTVLNAAARLIARLPRYSHISYIKDHLHWLPISKVLLIVLKAKMGVAPKYLRKAIRLPTSASSLRTICSLDKRELFVPRTRTIMAIGHV